MVTALLTTILTELIPQPLISIFSDPLQKRLAGKRFVTVAELRETGYTTLRKNVSLPLLVTFHLENHFYLKLHVFKVITCRYRTTPCTTNSVVKK